ncbi:M48 family metalloprotease [Bartonella sp. A5(2022)]|nr:M48 family metalloprotease [Bartonella sp. A05]
MPFLSACHINLTSSQTPFPFSSSATTTHMSDNDAYALLGAKQHPRILDIYGGAYNDPRLEHMLTKIVDKLTAAAQDPSQVYYVTILDSAHVNAFTLPGGYIYVTRGMLALANDTSEVAAVLAHEIAHLTANHGILRLQQKVALQQANHMPNDLLYPSTSESQHILETKRKMAQFSRNQELQADSIAIEMLHKAGYNPFASPRFLQSMENYRAFHNISGTQNTSLDFLATHPTTPQRIHLAIEKARKISQSYIGKTDHDRFLNRDRFLKSIDGMIFGGSFRDGYVRGNQFIHPQLRVAFSIPNNFTIENSPHAVLASGPDKTALRFDAVPLPANMSASDYLKSGWIAGLDESSVRPILIQGLSAAHARATNEHWQFDVMVIPIENRVFRFITAAPHHSRNFDTVAKSTTQSFHLLSSPELNKLKPLRIRVVRVKQGETPASLANKMQDIPNKEKLFRILNALSPAQTLQAGTHVKIIAE